MAILTETGRASVAHYLSMQPLHMAWGNGSPDWDASPVPVEPGTTQVVSEIGRMAATRVQFAMPDSQGEIELPEGRFSITGVPTKYLMLSFDFSYSHAVGQDIRDLGVFVGTTTKPDVPVGTEYLLPNQIQSPGMMLVAERVVKFTRTSNVKQKFIYIIQF